MAFKIEQDQKIDCLEKHIIFLEQNLVFLIHPTNLVIYAMCIKHVKLVFSNIFSFQVEARNEIRYLKDHHIVLESPVQPFQEYNDTTNGISSSSELHLDDSPDVNLDCCDDFIYLVGGYDGGSWFSSLDFYSPSNNHIKSLKPMNTPRCYAPVSILNDQLYVFGGGTRGVWYDTGTCVYMY